MKTKNVPAVLIDTQNNGARYTITIQVIWSDGNSQWLTPKTVDYQGYRYAYCGRFPDGEPYYQTSIKL